MRARWRSSRPTRLAAAVTHAMDRLDDVGAARGELRAQVAHVRVDRALADVVIVAVDRRDQLAARQDATELRLLATLATQEDLEQGSLYPPLADIRRVSARIATAVAEIAFREKLATVAQPPDILKWVEESMYQPRYDVKAS